MLKETWRHEFTLAIDLSSANGNKQIGRKKRNTLQLRMTIILKYTLCYFSA